LRAAARARGSARAVRPPAPRRRRAQVLPGSRRSSRSAFRSNRRWPTGPPPRAELTRPIPAATTLAALMRRWLALSIVVFLATLGWLALRDVRRGYRSAHGARVLRFKLSSRLLHHDLGEVLVT